VFGENLKKARKNKGFTLKVLGEIIGVSHASLSQLESGKTLPMRKTKIALAKALGDNLGDPTLDEHINADEAPPQSERQMAQEMSVERLLSLKFGGMAETRSRAQMRALAQLLDAEIEKEARILGYPEHKKK
jgi:transcriptional regulator with XRE-family HTH domain